MDYVEIYLSKLNGIDFKYEYSINEKDSQHSKFISYYN
jgi:hypothetical protein